MGVFEEYSKYYDLLYKDKDYKGEVDYIDELIKIYHPHAKTVLDLGCGTGKHDHYLTKKGYNVYGVDISEEMISQAIKENNDATTYSVGDMRYIELNKCFDVVISLFHVMSYQITNDDIINGFKTAYKHLDKNGIFIFDCWYGPAVLTDRPSIRIKRLEDKNIQVIRIAELIMYPERNVVDVNYNIIIQDKVTDKTVQLKETHSMRYLFSPYNDTRN